MSELTLDGLIAELTKQREAGADGKGPVFIPARDNIGRPGFLQRVEMVATVPVAKADMDKGHFVCRIVSARGVPALVIR